MRDHGKGERIMEAIVWEFRSSHGLVRKIEAQISRRLLQKELQFAFHKNVTAIFPQILQGEQTGATLVAPKDKHGIITRLDAVGV